MSRPDLPFKKTLKRTKAASKKFIYFLFSTKAYLSKITGEAKNPKTKPVLFKFIDRSHQ